MVKPEGPPGGALATYAAAAAAPVWWQALTLPPSLLYGAAVAARNGLFDLGVLKAARLPGIVISVGNLVVGGTGKSPVTMALARLLLAAGKHPAILTRGYGSALARDDSLALLGGAEVMAPRAKCSWPDEAHMQTRALPEVPVIVGRNRYKAAMRYLAAIGDQPSANSHQPSADSHQHRPSALDLPTHWILDDGFQHRQLARDVDLVLLDATAPFANGHLLPCGLLRESPRSLERADLVVFTRCTAEAPKGGWEQLVAKLAGAPVVRAAFRPLPLAPVPGGSVAPSFGSVLLATGVAKPEQVRASLAALGVDVAATYAVADHAPFLPSELRRHLGKVRAVVTTAKDYWRDPSIFSTLPVPTLLLGMELEWDESAVKRVLFPG